ncbi:transposase [candidate division WOR-3 bacterium]|nr:transposase [candidate division WOR-3 bacterium]
MIRLDSEKQRKSIRLKEYDYSQSGAYFVTICTYNQEMYFEQYPELKAIVLGQWQKLPDRFPNIELDEFVIMPNHIHGIIFIVDTDSNVGAGLAPALNLSGATARVAPTVGEIIGSYKSICITKWLRYIRQNNINTLGKFWQRNYYEHIIRNKHSLNRIQEYIHYNPLKWELDRENPARIGTDEFDEWLYGKGK